MATNNITKVDENACPICFDTMGTKSAKTTCNHRFCKKCITDWSKKSKECPLCRQKFEVVADVAQQSMSSSGALSGSFGSTTTTKNKKPAAKIITPSREDQHYEQLLKAGFSHDEILAILLSQPLTRASQTAHAPARNEPVRDRDEVEEVIKTAGNMLLHFLTEAL